MKNDSARILLIEDERALREALADALSAEGFSVEQAATGGAGLTASSVFKKILESRDAVKEIVKETPQPSDLEAVVNEADTILKALEQRALLKALSNRIK